MANKRPKITGKGRCGKFLQLPHHIINHERYPTLKAHTLKALVDISVQFNGFNNGALIATWKYMETRGWKSKETFYASRAQLLDNGLIIISQYGHKRVLTRYAITWLAIDHCNGQHQLTPTNAPLGAWKDPGQYPRPKNANPIFNIDDEYDGEIIPIPSLT